MWRGELLKAGIQSDGRNITILNGTLQAQNVMLPVGNVYYVDKRVSSSGSGRSWAEAYKTIAEAITTMRARIDWSETPWALNDICYIGPGAYAENLTALPHGCVLVGAGWDMRDAQFGTKIKPASGSPVDVGGVINCGFVNLGFEVADTSAIFDSEVTNNCLFQDCYFTGPAETSTAAAGLVAMDMTATKIIGCRFSCMDKGIDVNYSDGGDKFAHMLIDNCIFDQIDTCGIEISASLVGPSSLVRNSCFFGGGVTMAYAINDSIACIDVMGCNAESTNGYNGVRSVNGSYNNGALVT